MTTTNGNKVETMPFTQFINASVVSGDNAITEWFGKLELQDKKKQLLDILKIISPSIRDISTIVVSGQVQLYARIGKKLLPLKLAGDGLNKLLFIVLAIIANPDSVILIDEIETGFHYSMYAKLWETLSKAALENGCQIVASTHSYECIIGALDGIKDAGKQDEFCYFRINQSEAESYAHRYSDDLLRAAIATEMDVR